MPNRDSPLARVVRVVRGHSGLGQVAFGEALGVSRATVSYWENGRVLPPVARLDAMADLIQMPLSELLALGER